MPAVSEGVDRFCDLILKGKIDPAQFFAVKPEDGDQATDGWIKDLKISPANASF